MILIVDGNNIASRARYAFGDSLTDSVGNHTGVLYGVLNTLLSYIEKHRPSKLIICWDKGRTSWRKKLYPEYKANRKREILEDGEIDRDYEQYIRQINILQNFLDLHPCYNLHFPGQEADDLISASCINHKDYEKYIVTSDHDFYQLVSLRTKIYDPDIKKGKIVNENYVKEKYGISASDFIYLKAMVGDPSDNIEGYPQVGDKTAAKLINMVIGNTPQDYWNDRALNIYYEVKRGRVIYEDKAETLKRNFKMMSLPYGYHKLPEEIKSEISTRLNTPLTSYSSSAIQMKLIQMGMNNFASRFMKYKSLWDTLINS